MEETPKFSLTFSPQIDEIGKALHAVQSIGVVAIETQQNKQVGAAYADTFSVWNALQEPLKLNGFSVLQLPADIRKVGDEYVASLESLVIHTSGQWVKGRSEFIIQFIPSKSGTGLSKTWASASTITYLRRYTLVCLFGVITGDDDDAQRFVEKAAAEPNIPRPEGRQGAGTWGSLTGGKWKEERAPDQKLFEDWTNKQVKDLIRKTIEEEPENEAPALKAFLSDEIDARLRTLKEELEPALTARGWKDSLVPDDWSLKGFRNAFNQLFQEKQSNA